ncbi:mitochondrial 54S ribosomal protein bL31m [Kwoniella pini CBS 10737]|uniref:Uncharacterized protein n=1 Tax=Kwoniella pini CBS 10737 TaxID=1296096 RepID=A0A1B9HTP5_9TREE|nr:uncharacterized protein I206_07488 [Kwoniella pini CBS 10737]OCF46635.1 hypothetical protein I206_07488 [Kwoniella pini CBS 10737]
MSFSVLRPSSSKINALRPIVQVRGKHTHSTPESLWQSRTHLKPPPSIPPPMVPTYPMRVILSDGSTFTAYTTAPTPSTKKLTRDVNNNPLWSPASERKGLGEGEEGRVGRFRRRFEGIVMEEPEASLEDKKEEAFGAGDLDWMSEGGVEEKISEKQRNPVKAGKAKGKKK